MGIDRITHPLRLARGSHQPGSSKGCAMNVISYINRRRGSLVIGKVLVGAAAAVISVGLAAPAGASPVPPPRTVPDFLGAVRAAGVTGTDPAMLGDGYNVCWQLWNQHASGIQVAAGLVRDHPQLTSDEAAHFVLAAYNDLCPVPGAYDYWAYSTG
jgi:Protein of unknown function (DUF732)